MKTRPIVLPVTYMLVFSILASAEDPPVFGNASQVLDKFTESRKSLNSFIVTGHQKTTYSYAEFKGIKAESTPSSSYLLDKLTENLDGLKSVIITTETITQGSKRSDMKNFGKKLFTLQTFRTDGTRTRSCMEIWGGILNRDIEKKDALYKSGLWDGENHYQYEYAADMSGTLATNGRVHLTPKIQIQKFDNNSTITTRTTIESTSGTVLGCFPLDDNRIDHILRTCSDVKVKDQKVQVGDSLCFVLEAETYTGKYKIYLDSERNYSIAKLQNIKTAGDKAFPYGYELQGQDNINYAYETKEFKNIDGQWVPSKSESIHKRTMQDGRFLSVSKTDGNIKEILLNPDHEAMKSFVPDDIKDGALVTIAGITEIAYTWQNGELVPIQ